MDKEQIYRELKAISERLSALEGPSNKIALDFDPGEDRVKAHWLSKAVGSLETARQAVTNAMCTVHVAYDIAEPIVTVEAEEAKE